MHWFDRGPEHPRHYSGNCQGGPCLGNDHCKRDQDRPETGFQDTCWLAARKSPSTYLRIVYCKRELIPGAGEISRRRVLIRGGCPATSLPVGNMSQPRQDGLASPGTPLRGHINYLCRGSFSLSQEQCATVMVGQAILQPGLCDIAMLLGFP
jgi:hypothetical protein